MKIYIIHYGIMDNDGVLQIKCKRCDSFEDAQCTRDQIVDKFIEENADIIDDILVEEFGKYKRVAYYNRLIEIQTEIVEFDI